MTSFPPVRAKTERLEVYGHLCGPERSTSHSAELQQTDLHVRGKSPRLLRHLVTGADRLAEDDLGHKVSVFCSLFSRSPRLIVTCLLR